MVVQKFAHRVWADLRRKEFIPLKILYFMVYGGMFTLFPFLSVQARSLGIKEAEIGSIYGALPLLGVLAMSASGMFADKIGNFKIFLSITMATSGISSLVFLAIPVARITHKMPDLLPLQVNCGSNGSVTARIQAPFQCEFNEAKKFEASVTTCRLMCSSQRTVTLPLSGLLRAELCSVTPECRDQFPEILENNSNFSSKVENRLSYNPLQVDLQLEQYEEREKLLVDETFCPDIKELTVNFTTYTVNNNFQTSNYCWFECDATANRTTTCQNTVTTEDINPFFTIIIYVLVRILHAISLVASLPLFEGATIAILQEYGGDIGLQRMYSNIGQVIMTPLSGALIDTFSPEGSTNFKPAFYLYCAINILSAICISFIDLRFKKPAKKLTKELKILLANFEVITLIIIGFIVGLTLGVIDTFLFWILENMGASKSLMGLTITVGSSVGIPMMMFATPIISKIGHVNTLIIGISFFVLRLLGYSFITNPWWAMPFEAMECFTTALFSVAHVSYAASLSTPTTVVSLQSLSAGILHGVGRGVGSMIGGFMTKGAGLRVTFRIFAVICGLTAIVYSILNVLFFRKNQIKRKITKEKEAKSSNQNNLESIATIKDNVDLKETSQITLRS